MVTEDGKVIEGFERGVLFSSLSTDKKGVPFLQKNKSENRHSDTVDCKVSKKEGVIR